NLPAARLTLDETEARSNWWISSRAYFDDGYTILEIIKDEVFDTLHDEDAVSLCCLCILQLVLLGTEAKRRIPDWMLRLANDRV
nr:hypothetical protein [Tanacetum cinerariifolium]